MIFKYEEYLFLLTSWQIHLVVLILRRIPEFFHSSKRGFFLQRFTHEAYSLFYTKFYKK